MRIDRDGATVRNYFNEAEIAAMTPSERHIILAGSVHQHGNETCVETMKVWGGKRQQGYIESVAKDHDFEVTEEPHK